MNQQNKQTPEPSRCPKPRSLWPMLVIGLLVAEALFCITTLVIATANPPIRVDQPLPVEPTNGQVKP